MSKYYWTNLSEGDVLKKKKKKKSPRCRRVHATITWSV